MVDDVVAPSWCRASCAVREVAAQLGDLGLDATAVGLELRLTGATATDALTAGRASAGLAGQLAAPAAQALGLVLQLGHLDLRLALGALGVLGEDVEDQRRAVDDLDLGAVLQVAQLAGRELAVADDRVGAGGLRDVAQLVDLAAADVGGRVGLRAALHQRVEHLRAGGLGEQLELGEGVLGVLGRALGPDADEHDLLEAQLPVLDLGDVLELGREAGDAAERVALLELEVQFGFSHAIHSMSPRATISAGPVRTRWSSSFQVTCRVPPGTSTR